MGGLNSCVQSSCATHKNFCGRPADGWRRACRQRPRLAASIKCDERPFKGDPSLDVGLPPPAMALCAPTTKTKNKFEKFSVLAGLRCPPDPPGFGWEFWLGGQSLPRPTPKKSYLAFDRGGQTGPPRSNAFFPAQLTTRAPPTTVRQTSDDRSRYQ